jgi:3-hydroxyisobutyrate dehydrogenase-like beta-hydroxyacid dehydrogenase
MRVAVVGTGRMGAAMARRVGAAGHDVTLYNRTPQTAARLADEIGAGAVDRARDAAVLGEVIIVSLADDDAVRATYEGDDGLLAGLSPGAVVCDTSTVDPETPRRLAALAIERGGSVLDTPVSGSVPLIERGELTVLAGGDAEALDRARPVLESFASTIFHLGDVGAGAVMKLVVNSVVHALNAAVSEALVLAEKAGLDRATTYDVLESSAVAAPFVKYKRSAFVDPESSAVAFSLALVAKDYDLIARLADDVGASMQQADTTRSLVAHAIADADLGDSDMAALATYLRQS